VNKIRDILKTKDQVWWDKESKTQIFLSSEWYEIKRCLEVEDTKAGSSSHWRPSDWEENPTLVNVK
jgi:hypothetical protein